MFDDFIQAVEGTRKANGVKDVSGGVMDKETLENLMERFPD